jgi:D-beta-D-heptose 7-phosphate kinase/D-beta-D-heptose 1-phosphate adenosyltransferase
VTASFQSVVEGFADLRVLVVGDAILDTYQRGSATRLCREAPAPVVAVVDRVDAAGGAANTAASARALGAQVALVAAVGQDDEGQRLERLLAADGVSTRGLIASSARQTLAKQRVVADGQILVRFDQGSCQPLTGQVESALASQLAETFPTCDVVVVSDYGYGALTPGVRELLSRLQLSEPRVVVVDARDLARYRELGPTAVKPNYTEALSLLGQTPLAEADARVRQLEAAQARLLRLTGAQVCAVTLDTHGGLVFERGRAAYRTYARPSPAARATGAGDTFAAALGLALAAGADTPTAAEVASAAAGVVVGRDGTAVCSAVELRASLHGESQGKLLDERQLEAWLAACRARRRRVVFTNGCFDLLHRGHVTCLSRAKSLGDLLVVGLNSDASVQRLKGAGRPINAWDDRAQVLAALSCVDLVLPFDQDTPEDLIRVIRPDVFVKGGDYSLASLPEARLVEAQGGRVVILPYFEDRSTTHLIGRIRSNGYLGPRQPHPVHPA